jgi:hypothetical protein
MKRLLTHFPFCFQSWKDQQCRTHTFHWVIFYSAESAAAAQVSWEKMLIAHNEVQLNLSVCKQFTDSNIYRRSSVAFWKASHSTMEVVALSGGNTNAPFKREVHEWQHIDAKTGALLSGRLEADRYVNGNTNQYGKVSSWKLLTAQISSKTLITVA